MTGRLHLAGVRGPRTRYTHGGAGECGHGVRAHAADLEAIELDGAPVVLPLEWASDFRPRAALADRFRDGLVFLASDAATSPLPEAGRD